MHIGDDIQLVVLKSKGGRIQLGFDTPAAGGGPPGIYHHGTYRTLRIPSLSLLYHHKGVLCLLLQGKSRAEVLDQCYCPGRPFLKRVSSLMDQVSGNCSVNDTQNLPHCLGMSSEQLL